MGYKRLVEGILENPNDVAKIKSNITEMVTNYKWIMDLNHRELFWMLMEKSILAIMCLLMNEQSRSYYIPVVTEDDAEDNVINLGKGIVITPNYLYKGDMVREKKIENPDKEAMYEAICSRIATSDFRDELGENIISFAGATDGYWKDLEPKGKKYMIISMGNGDFVRSAGVSGGDLSNKDVKNKFIIVDGIDYKSNSTTRQLLYMEV